MALVVLAGGDGDVVPRSERRVMRYAVVTAARDEAENLPRLAASLAAQTQRPERWIIVENGSTDRTPEVARDLADQHPYVTVLTSAGSARPERGAPIARALELAFAELGNDAEVVVNVDADVSFGAEYFGELLRRFAVDPTLGIAGGSCFEVERGAWQQRHVTGSTVWGASRAYRTTCLRAVLPLDRVLGWDGVDELKANARGWRTQTFLDLPFFHHRPEGARDGGRAKARAEQGRAAWYLGYRPWYLALRAVHAAATEPAALAMIGGYVRAAARRERRLADAEARRYLRRQQSLLRLPLRVLEARRPRERVA